MTLQIQRVQAFPLVYPEPNDNDNLRTITLARVETSDGVVGWGECVTMWQEASRAVKTIIEDGLAPLLIGQNPLETTTLWERMKDHCWWYGEGGIASFAISALDIALWDVKGKLLGQPIYRLLGGARQKKLRVCASTHPAKANIDDLARELADHAQAGYTAVKVGFGKRGEANLGTDPQRDIAYVKTVRAALGDGVDFMVDMGKKNRYDPALTTRLVQAFEAHGLTWIEDPFSTDDPDSYHRLNQSTQTLIATGERGWTMRDYQRLIDQRIADVYLVDPGRAEGITTTRQIIDMLTARHLYFNAHTWSSAINTAASLHLAATAGVLVFELKPKPNPMQHELVAQPLQQIGGYVDVPELPGLGIEVDERVVKKYLLD